MEMQAILIVAALAVGLCATSTATWAACRWWYGQRLSAAAERLHKSDKGRHLLQQQALQAKQQVEQLKVELASQRQAAFATAASRQRIEAMQDDIVAAERAAVRLDIAARPASSPAPSGFADTQLMP